MQVQKNIISVILCGGVGRRLWPFGSIETPKQFIKSGFGGKSLFERTLGRAEKFSENILLVSNENFRNILEQQTTSKKHQYVFEPESRNTAASIIFSALIAAKNFPDSVMLIMPSDHWVENENAFSLDVIEAVELAEKENKIVLFGIRPDFASESFGYIIAEEKKEFYSVKKFVEKPKEQEAEKLIQNENVFWNSGIFIAKPEAILKNAQENFLENFVMIKKIFDQYLQKEIIDRELYREIDNIPFDKAVLENSKNLIMLPAQFDWLDVGTPERLEIVLKKISNQ